MDRTKGKISNKSVTSLGLGERIEIKDLGDSNAYFLRMKVIIPAYNNETASKVVTTIDPSSFDYVDWGDGVKESFETWSKNKTHVYSNTEEANYNITFYGLKEVFQTRQDYQYLEWAYIGLEEPDNIINELEFGWNTIIYADCITDEDYNKDYENYSIEIEQGNPEASGIRDIISIMNLSQVPPYFYNHLGQAQVHKGITLNSNVIKIGKRAFYNMFSWTHNKQLNIPNSVTHIFDEAFYSSYIGSNEGKIILNTKNLKYFGDNIVNPSSLQGEVIFSKNIKYIGWFTNYTGTKLFFEGSKEEFDNIEKSNIFKSVTVPSGQIVSNPIEASMINYLGIYYYSNNKPEKNTDTWYYVKTQNSQTIQTEIKYLSCKYWHYNDAGEPEIWGE